jgi:hypothetical protein
MDRFAKLADRAVVGRNKVLCCQVQAPAPAKPRQCKTNVCDFNRELCGLPETRTSLTSIERKSLSDVEDVEKRSDKPMVFMLAGRRLLYQMRPYPSRSSLFLTNLRRRVITNLYYYMEPGECPAPRVTTRPLPIQINRRPTNEELPRELETEHVEDVRIHA